MVDFKYKISIENNQAQIRFSSTLPAEKGQIGVPMVQVKETEKAFGLSVKNVLSILQKKLNKKIDVRFISESLVSGFVMKGSEIPHVFINTDVIINNIESADATLVEECIGEKFKKNIVVW